MMRAVRSSPVRAVSLFPITVDVNWTVQSPHLMPFLTSSAAVNGTGAAVIVDGGIRRGTDVVKALALGARMVMVGRPVLWGLAVDGEAGALAVLEILRAEVDMALALVGCTHPADLDQNYLTEQHK